MKLHTVDSKGPYVDLFDNCGPTEGANTIVRQLVKLSPPNSVAIVSQSSRVFVCVVAVRWYVDVCPTVFVLLNDHGLHVRSTLAWHTTVLVTSQGRAFQATTTQCPTANVVYIQLA